MDLKGIGMEKIGILIDTRNGVVKKTNFGAITAARDKNRELYAFLPDTVAGECKSMLETYGIHRIIEIATPEEPVPWNPVAVARAMISALEHFEIRTLVGLSSPWGKEVLARIAADLDAPLILDCLAVDFDRHVVRKSQFSGKITAVMKISGEHRIYGIRPNAVDSIPLAQPTEAQVDRFDIEVDSSTFSVKEILENVSAGIDLSEADVILSGGRGMENGENFKLLFECADAINAAVGASRVAVDSGWVPYSMQVGQTGSTVSPKVYMAFGISGSVQHFAGMKTSSMIIAINTDRKAAIIRNCDYFVIADLFEILSALNRELYAGE